MATLRVCFQSMCSLWAMSWWARSPPANRQPYKVTLASQGNLLAASLSTALLMLAQTEEVAYDAQMILAQHGGEIQPTSPWCDPADGQDAIHLSAVISEGLKARSPPEAWMSLMIGPRGIGEKIEFRETFLQTRQDVGILRKIPMASMRSAGQNASKGARNAVLHEHNYWLLPSKNDHFPEKPPWRWSMMNEQRVSSDEWIRCVCATNPSG